AQILKAQNMTTIMTKAYLLEENEEKIKLRKIIGDGGVDLFEEI
ncbi:8460_t:CDS:1, partial [Diversispora eburnea]